MATETEAVTITTHPVAMEDVMDARGVLAYLESVPYDTTAWDIYSTFCQYGSIVFVELEEVPSDDRARGAKFRFEPPPKDLSFIINGRCHVLVQGRGSLKEHWTYITFGSLSRNDKMILTPNHKSCAPVKRLKPTSLTFGLFSQADTVMGKKTVRNLDVADGLKLTVDFKRRLMALHLQVQATDPNSPEPKSNYRLDIKFDRFSASRLSSKKIYRTDLDGKRWALVICLDDPPLVFKRRTSMQSAFWGGLLQWTEKDAWLRAVDIASESSDRDTHVSLDREHSGIDIGRWRTFWVEMDHYSKQDWLDIETALADWNIKVIKNVPLKLTSGESTKAELWSILEAEEKPLAKIPDTTSWSADLALLISSSAQSLVRLPFDVRYQLEVCISRGVLSEYNITREFVEKLLELSSSNARIYDNDRARLVLEYAADQGKRIFNPMDLFQDHAAMTYFPPSWQIPEYCALVRKVIVTPTTMYFNTPMVETSNRVLRHFQHVQQYFLRVQFTDELPDGRIMGSDVERDNELYARCYHILKEGIRMGRWHWKFLAFGNSQIRENGVYLFCENEGGPTCDSMREWMGKFSHITVIAKYAARLGQCFSTTRLIRGITSPRPVKIKDVERNGRCFTDGVGKISPFLASMVTQDWQLLDPPSAFQFRMGGCKGVLVTWNDAKGFEVHVRKSQEKFIAEFNGLEIIRCSQFATATLNRQTITILSTLGVDDAVFVDMMENQLRGYNEALTDRAKAIELLQKYVDENQMTTVIAQMVLDGFMHNNEPFVQTLLRLWRAWSIKALKEKARIVVDEGAFVLGCVDETGTLRGHDIATEGRARVGQNDLPQIFLQVPEKGPPGTEGKPTNFKVITGLCLVGRNPSLHPGDIRVVEAVDVLALRHIRNAVVFPIKGDRDVPGMLAGGDLDGDDFFVIWDKRLLPKQHYWGTPPMDYTGPRPQEEPSGVTADHLKAFFVLHMKNNQLGLIAHAHLATADYEEMGANHPKCLELTDLHSQAVDYVKTGVPAVFDRKRLSPRGYPHFMEKSRKTYRSTTALGQLYDMAKREDFRFKASYETPFDSRILKRYRLAPEMLKRARQIKSQYDTAMRRVMGQMEIDTEFEVFSTFVLRKPRYNSDYKLQERLGHESSTLKQVFRDLCRKEVGGSRDLDALGPFVAAMYTVTYEEVRIALFEARNEHIGPDGRRHLRHISPRFMPLISFPWLFNDILGKIVRGTGYRPTLAGLGTTSASHKKLSKPPTAPNIENEMAGDDPNADGEVDYMRTAEGLIIHRGEVLHLFDHDSDAGSESGDDEIDPSRNSSAADGSEVQRQRNGRANGTVAEPLALTADNLEYLSGQVGEITLAERVEKVGEREPELGERQYPRNPEEPAREKSIEGSDEEFEPEELEVGLDFDGPEETPLDRFEQLFCAPSSQRKNGGG
ncbi:RdRP-domain-containing protein [Thozetella sp. PMI_491]|nr:RdRP-domain-containing protein [Thozetella sp. PMI_491]